ncbi:hypothetical protein GO755_40740 [Spirosoma sp. HMF4905]|uniref:Uncharacterized protein n=1 Tax=Spirosoma arboris TaxID=2682092 RepID=A0A7K1SRE7_9BACT|nr:hypothetical protein [Spirosoma arboris]MVM36394.1 hypothetical protein [Spirosoma arboris]
MTTNEKRQLLALVLSGDTEALRVYQAQRAVKDLDTRIVIDSRPVGGPIQEIDKAGIIREISIEEFDALPEQARSRIVTIIDTMDGHKRPAPDEDYSNPHELNN